MKRVRPYTPSEEDEDGGSDGTANRVWITPTGDSREIMGRIRALEQHARPLALEPGQSLVVMDDYQKITDMAKREYPRDDGVIRTDYDTEDFGGKYQALDLQFETALEQDPLAPFNNLLAGALNEELIEIFDDHSKANFQRYDESTRELIRMERERIMVDADKKNKQLELLEKRRDDTDETVKRYRTLSQSMRQFLPLVESMVYYSGTPRHPWGFPLAVQILLQYGLFSRMLEESSKGVSMLLVSNARVYIQELRELFHVFHAVVEHPAASKIMQNILIYADKLSNATAVTKVAFDDLVARIAWYFLVRDYILKDETSMQQTVLKATTLEVEKTTYPNQEKVSIDKYLLRCLALAFKLHKNATKKLETVVFTRSSNGNVFTVADPEAFKATLGMTDSIDRIQGNAVVLSVPSNQANNTRLEDVLDGVHLDEAVQQDETMEELKSIYRDSVGKEFEYGLWMRKTDTIDDNFKNLKTDIDDVYDTMATPLYRLNYLTELSSGSVPGAVAQQRRYLFAFVDAVIDALMPRGPKAKHQMYIQLARFLMGSTKDRTLDISKDATDTKLKIGQPDKTIDNVIFPWIVTRVVENRESLTPDEIKGMPQTMSFVMRTNAEVEEILDLITFISNSDLPDVFAVPRVLSMICQSTWLSKDMDLLAMIPKNRSILPIGMTYANIFLHLFSRLTASMLLFVLYVLLMDHLWYLASGQNGQVIYELYNEMGAAYALQKSNKGPATTETYRFLATKLYDIVRSVTLTPNPPLDADEDEKYHYLEHKYATTNTKRLEMPSPGTPESLFGDFLIARRVVALPEIIDRYTVGRYAKEVTRLQGVIETTKKEMFRLAQGDEMQIKDQRKHARDLHMPVPKYMAQPKFTGMYKYRPDVVQGIEEAYNKVQTKVEALAGQELDMFVRAPKASGLLGAFTRLIATFVNKRQLTFNTQYNKDVQYKIDPPNRVAAVREMRQYEIDTASNPGPVVVRTTPFRTEVFPYSDKSILNRYKKASAARPVARGSTYVRPTYTF